LTKKRPEQASAERAQIHIIKRKAPMNNFENRKQMRLLLLLAVALLLTMTTAIAGETGNKATSCAVVDINENLEAISSCKDAVKPADEKSNQNLIKELLQPDTSLLAELERKDVLPVIDVNRPAILQTEIMEPAP
jgi:hypothetical protein